MEKRAICSFIHISIEAFCYKMTQSHSTFRYKVAFGETSTYISVVVVYTLAVSNRAF